LLEFTPPLLCLTAVFAVLANFFRQALFSLVNIAMATVVTIGMGEA
jgi:hypothetical protein